MQPPQLAKAFKPKKSRHAIVETLHYLDVTSLNRAGALPLRDRHTRYRLPNIGFNCPPIIDIVSSHFQVEITLRSRKQSILVHWFRTGFGYRPALVCPCGRRCYRLFHGFGGFACRFCCNAIYASQAKSKQGRALFQACKLRLRLGGIPQPGLTIPARRKQYHKANYQRLRSRVQYLEAKGRKAHYKPDHRIFAYYA